MAVDTNVLIYERVREELAANKPLRAAIAAGYPRAFRVIFDAHFTAILTGVILVSMGSGPVKGFGVTLIIGLLANLFSGVFVTRLIFDWLVAKGWMKSFNMLHVFRHLPHVNFLGVWKIVFTLSWALIIAGMAMFFTAAVWTSVAAKSTELISAAATRWRLGFAHHIDADDIRHTLGTEPFRRGVHPVRARYDRRQGSIVAAVARRQDGRSGQASAGQISAGAI